MISVHGNQMLSITQKRVVKTKSSFSTSTGRTRMAVKRLSSDSGFTAMVWRLTNDERILAIEFED